MRELNACFWGGRCLQEADGKALANGRKLVKVAKEQRERSAPRPLQFDKR